jgi:hypothetical protein
MQDTPPGQQEQVPSEASLGAMAEKLMALGGLSLEEAGLRLENPTSESTPLDGPTPESPLDIVPKLPATPTGRDWAVALDFKDDYPVYPKAGIEASVQPEEEANPFGGLGESGAVCGVGGKGYETAKELRNHAALEPRAAAEAASAEAQIATTVPAQASHHLPPPPPRTEIHIPPVPRWIVASPPCALDLKGTGKDLLGSKEVPRPSSRESELDATIGLLRGQVVALQGELGQAWEIAGRRQAVHPCLSMACVAYGSLCLSISTVSQSGLPSS